LASMRGERAVAFYSANANLVFASLLLSQGLVTSVFPRVAQGGLDAAPVRHVLRRALTVSLAAGAPLAVVAATLGAPLLATLYGPTYREGARSLALLMGTV